MTVSPALLEGLADDPDDVLHERDGRVDRLGLGYRCRMPDGTTLIADRLRDGRDGLQAEITVKIAGNAVVSKARTNLSSVAARSVLVRALTARTNGSSPDWAGYVERFAVGVLDDSRRGEPFTTIGTMPASARRRYLLAPLLPVGQPTLLFAPGGTGKSTLANAIAISVATGVEIIPGWRPQRGAVLVLDYESDAATWNDRTARICAGAGIAPVEIFYRIASRPLAEQAEDLSRFVAERSIALLVADSVGLASGVAREGSDANETALRLFAALRAIGATSLLVDHVKGDDLGVDSARQKSYGSIYKVNLARNVYELRREAAPTNGRAEIALLHTKTNDGPRLPPIGLAIEYDGDTGPIVFRGADIEAPDLAQAALSGPQRIERLLAAGPRTAAFIAGELGMKPEAVRSYLSRDGGKRFARLLDGRIGLVRHDG